MTLSRSPLLLALAALAPACSTFSDTSESAGSDSTASGSATDSDTGGPGETVTIYDIQQGKVPVDLVVQLKNVIATSPVYFDKNKKAFFFVAEAAGGPFSGIQVYIYDDVAVELGAGLPKMGDTLSLRATYTEFFELSQLTVSAASDVTITGPGTIPAPSVVTAAEITTKGAKAEDYEGCLVQIVDAEVTAPVVEFGEFEVDDALKVDDLFFVPSPGPKPAVGTTFTALVGQMTYSFEEFKLAPRTCADYQGWDGCEDPDPTGDPTTGDPTTDDPTTGDPTGDPTGENVAATIYDIQMGMHAPGTYVDVTNVVVTSPFVTNDKDAGYFFIAEAPGGEYSGIQVYVYADIAAELLAADKLPKLGDRVDVSGQYTEFFDFSQITLAKTNNLAVTGAGTIPAADVVAPADIATGGPKAENYEGCLVEVKDVTVTSPVEFGEFSVTGGLRVDDFFFVPNPGPKPAMGAAFSSITGLLGYSFEEFKLYPRDFADLVD
ncbi:MAG: hypothetical protein H0T76_16820 [Nannocystis sp.]|nr:hypothetical protein [Nannocystis sp.]MBA3548147.1 hypothetical protein [Nannocystis sp.]